YHRPFCFPYPRYHATLHSFPTRRSSDLHVPRRRYRDEPLAVGGTVGGQGVRHHEVRVVRGTERAVLAERGAPLQGALRVEAGRGDRKSTRLNSSHVAISYAVFCLKKKTY